MGRTNGKLGLFDSVHLLVGGMIGSAIFSLSGITILQAGPASLVSWLLGALILLAYGLQTAELASHFPQSGGVFVFPSKLLGRFWGWASAWAYLFGCIAGAAFSAIYVGIYLQVAFPSLGNLQVLIGVLAVVVCGVLNLVKFRLTGKATTVLTLFLGITLVAFMVAVFSSGKWDGSQMIPFFSQGLGGPFGFLEALPLAMVAYGAIVALSFLVGEVDKPTKTVPKAMVIAMAIVLVLYLFVLLATLGLVSSEYLAENVGVQYIPLYAAAGFLPSASFLTPLISISAVLALLTTMIVTMALAAHTLKSCAENRVLPSFLAMTGQRSGSPVSGTLLVILVTGVLTAFPNLTNLLINLGALCNVIVVAVVCLSVLVCRKQSPQLEAGKFRAPGGKTLPVVTLIILVASYVPGVLQGGWQLWSATAVYFLLGLLFYRKERSAA